MLSCILVFIFIFYFFVSQRFNRYPLIIDPSGQATEFILNEFRDRKITKTSFLDDSFRKNLESALRFGNPLLVQVFFSYVIMIFLINSSRNFGNFTSIYGRWLSDGIK